MYKLQRKLIWCENGAEIMILQETDCLNIITV